MLLIPNNVNQTMDFQGTIFRPMRRAKGIGRGSSSAEKFGKRQILIGGRQRKGMSGQSAAAGGVWDVANSPAVWDRHHSIGALSVRAWSQRDPVPGNEFPAGCRVSTGFAPGRCGQKPVAHTCESLQPQRSRSLPRVLP